MSEFAISPPTRTALPVAGGDSLFPVRRVYCIGRNYADHAREMGHDPNREPPFFFQKNPDNLDPSGAFPYPARSSDVQHEVELAVMLKSGGVGIPVDKATDCVFGYAVSIDMTRRDLQAEQKKLGRPWEIGKAFEQSAPVSAVVPVNRISQPTKGAITLSVNGSMRQSGDLAQMIWSVPEMISTLSEYFRLAAGDVILSGTPAGVGPVARGDVMLANIEGVGTLEVSVT